MDKHGELKNKIAEKNYAIFKRHYALNHTQYNNRNPKSTDSTGSGRLKHVCERGK